MADNLLDKASILLTPTAYNNGSMLSVKPTDGDGDFTFVRGSAATRVNAQGLVEEVTDTNLPRINYEGFSYDGNGDIIPNSGCGSWLLEPQSTNLFVRSNELTDIGNWPRNSSLITTGNATISPDGTLNATRFVNVGNGNRLGQEVALTSGLTYTFSFYIKNNGGNASLLVDFDGQSASQSYTITNDWARYEFTFTATSTETSQIRLFRSVSDIDLFAFGTQLEQQSYATSYIPTSGASSTRLQDLATDSGNASLINSTEGVLYAEIAALENSGESIRAISLGVNGDNNQTITIRFRNQNNSIGLFMKPLSPNNLNLSTEAFNILNFNKIALKYKSGEIALWINGTEVITSTNTLNIVGLNKLDFNSLGSNNFFGKTKAIAVWKEALSDSELQSLTTI